MSRLNVWQLIEGDSYTSIEQRTLLFRMTPQREKKLRLHLNDSNSNTAKVTIKYSFVYNTKNKSITITKKKLIKQ